MKTIMTLCIGLLILISSQPCESQFLENIKKKAQEKIEREAERRAQRRVDKKIDEEFDESDVLTNKLK